MSVELSVPDNSWEPTGSDEDLNSRLLVTVHINGIPHHLEALAVVEEDGIQEAADDMFSTNYEGLCQMSEPDGRYQTAEIKGREYVITMTPFC